MLNKRFDLQLIGLMLVFFMGAFVLIMLNAPKASATYNGGRLIDDSVFRDDDDMNKTQIQTFLQNMNSGLKTKQYKLSCYGASSRERQLYTDAGADCDELMPASHI